MATVRTKAPSTTQVHPIVASAKDSFTGEEFEAKGTVAVHTYRDHSKLVFAKVKTPFGIGTLKLSFHPQIGWSKDAQHMPCRHVAIAWGALAPTLAQLAA